MTNPIAILGSGPSGLLAAHACATSGIPFAIFSNPTKSILGGAQFLQRHVPGITGELPDTHINYVINGSPDHYREKVYGDNPLVPFISMTEVYNGFKQPAWSLRGIYDELWERYADAVNHVAVTPQWLAEHIDDFRLVISSIHLPSICKSPMTHQFPKSKFYLKHEAIDPNIGEDTIWFDCSRDRSWYRMSMIFGVGSTEWGQIKPPMNDIVTLYKPLQNNCDCWPQILRVGRNGRWEKGILSHDGFYRTMGAIN